MNKNEKQVITVLSIVIVVVIALFAYSWIKEGRSSSGDEGQVDSVKEEIQNGTQEGTAEADASTDSKTTTAQTSTTSTIKATESATAQSPKTVMDADDGYIFPDANISYVSATEIKKLTTEQIQYAINEIYARRGLKFTKSKNKERFEKKVWYKGTVDEQDDITLNTYEKKNVNTMAAELKKRGAR